MAELDHAAELATEAVGEAASVARNHVTWFWGGWIVGLTMGASVGYSVALRKMEDRFAKKAEDEIDAMREHFKQRMIVRDSKPDLGDLSKKAENLGYRSERGSSVSPSAAPSPPAPPGKPNVQPQETVKNVFETPKSKIDDWDGWSYEEEMKGRDAGARIYVIHKDEYGETDNNDTSLTFYEGDDVLCDENDRVIEDPYKLVGDCLDHFGHGSGDRNVVFVRNEDLDLDLEVIKTHKTYAEEVHGLSHEDSPRRRRPRQQE